MGGAGGRGKGGVWAACSQQIVESGRGAGEWLLGSSIHPTFERGWSHNLGCHGGVCMHGGKAGWSDSGSSRWGLGLRV